MSPPLVRARRSQVVFDGGLVCNFWMRHGTWNCPAKESRNLLLQLGIFQEILLDKVLQMTSYLHSLTRGGKQMLL